MRKLHPRHTQNAFTAIGILLVSSIVLTAIWAFGNIIIEVFPISFYVIFGLLLFWCLLYKLSERFWP